MYGHVKTLKKMGSADIPDGTSIQTKGVKYKSGYESTASSSSSAKRDTATGSKAKIRQGVQGDTRGISQSSKENKPDVSFNRFKGVVNTMDGAKDVNRKKDEDTRLPPKSQRNKAQVVDLSTLDHKGSAAREKAKKPEKDNKPPASATKKAETHKTAQRAPATVRKLGKGSANDEMSVQEKRAAFFEKQFAKSSS